MATQITTLGKIGKYLRKTANKAWNPGAKDLHRAARAESKLATPTALENIGAADPNKSIETKILRETAKKSKLYGNMKNIASRGAIATAVVGTPVGFTLKAIKKQSIEDDKYYVLKNDKVIHEFVKKEDAQKYAAVHNGAVNKGSTLKQKVAG
jgi:translation elongation factor EF-1beta